MTLHARTVAAAVGGALVISTSATLVLLSGATPATSAFFRCAYAVPALAALAWAEARRQGPLTWRPRALAWAAGLFFALDLLCWHRSIGYVGAGLATVLGNLQVFVVAFAAWALLGERPSPRLMVATPVVFGGVVLISGLLDEAAYGSDPALGVFFGALTSLSYAAYLMLLRACGRRAAGPLAHATVASTVVIALLGPGFGGVEYAFGWPSHGWLLLLALGPQVAGWALISYSLPRQPAALTSLLLLVQPVCALGVAAAVLGERPSPLQLLGCAVIAAGVLYGSRQPAASAAAQDEQVPKTSTV